MPTVKICEIIDCGKPTYAKGLCRPHYQRLLRYGDPTAGRAPDGTSLHYLNNVVLPYGWDQCLIWPFWSDRHGYGRMWIRGHRFYVHRFVCESINGPPPTPKHEASHSCGKGHEGCCAPRHLRWATHKENMADTIGHRTLPIGESNGQAKLTKTAIIEIRTMGGTMLQREIGSKFGVSRTTISDIINRKYWAWLP